MHQLKESMENLESQVKVRDERRDRSQKAIKETLSRLEGKLANFTQTSLQNQGGLAKI